MTGSRNPAGKALRYAGAIAITVVTLFWFGPRTHDRLFWPESAHDRIEGMAKNLRRIGRPARWRYPSVNSSNIYKSGNAVSERLDECLKHIEPVSDFLEVGPNHYIKRFYREKRPLISARSHCPPYSMMTAWSAQTAILGFFGVATIPGLE
jgi:hypothetical protein